MKELVVSIEKMRRHKGLSKRNLAEMADISEEYYWKIITGKAPGCSYEIINNLCDAVGIMMLTYISLDDVLSNLPPQ